MKSLDLSFIIVDGIVHRHGTSRHLAFGGGKFDALEDFKAYKEAIRTHYTVEELNMIETYFKTLYEERIK